MSQNTTQEDEWSYDPRLKSYYRHVFSQDENKWKREYWDPSETPQTPTEQTNIHSSASEADYSQETGPVATYSTATGTQSPQTQGFGNGQFQNPWSQLNPPLQHSGWQSSYQNGNQPGQANSQYNNQSRNTGSRRILGLSSLSRPAQEQFFKPGRVFVMNWSQPHYNGTGPFEEPTLFVVIKPKPNSNFSRCVAIHSYGGRGTTAPHARVDEHVMIYTGQSPPPLLSGEPSELLDRQPIQVINEARGLDPESRVNLAKLYPVSHDLPVRGVGHVNSHQIPELLRYVRRQNEDWATAPETEAGFNDIEE